MIAVFGAGFGLYGHLPALAELGREVGVLHRYRDVITARSELKSYLPCVRFFESEEQLIGSSSAAVLARRPDDNERLAYLIAASANRQPLVLEKPACPDVGRSRFLFDELRARGIPFAIPYLFAYCDWTSEARDAILRAAAPSIVLDWSFPTAPGQGETWKSQESQAGGLVGYYYIHILALVVYLMGPDTSLVSARSQVAGGRGTIVAEARRGSTSFHGRFSNEPGDARFSLTVDGDPVCDLPTPFGPVPQRGHRDPRIDALKRFYTATLANGPALYVGDRDDAVLTLWAELTELVDLD